MKKILFLISLTYCIHCKASEVPKQNWDDGKSKIAALGNSFGVGNGGDPCEERIIGIRDDIRSWIEKGGAESLDLPDGISLDDYHTKMLSRIDSAEINCTDKKIIVFGSEKTCGNSGSEGQVHCNFNRFMSSSEEEQYRLVHHEYAGLSGIEQNLGAPESDYVVSDQLSAYLEEVTIKRLSIKKVTRLNTCDAQAIQYMDQYGKDDAKTAFTYRGLGVDWITSPNFDTDLSHFSDENKNIIIRKLFSSQNSLVYLKSYSLKAPTLFERRLFLIDSHNCDLTYSTAIKQSSIIDSLLNLRLGIPSRRETYHTLTEYLDYTYLDDFDPKNLEILTVRKDQETNDILIDLHTHYTVVWEGEDYDRNSVSYWRYCQGFMTITLTDLNGRVKHVTWGQSNDSGNFDFNAQKCTRKKPNQ